MSILINMEMPKGCASCFLKYGSCSSIRRRTDESKGDKWCPENYRHPDCPLVEVPNSHGRLIDADALHFVKGFDEDDPLDYVRRYKIDNAPTIIPADKESHDD